MDQIPNEPIGVETPPPSDGDSTPKWLTRKEYDDPAEKKKDFWLGFGLWWGLNIALTLCQWGVGLALVGALGGDGYDSTPPVIFNVVSIIGYTLPWVVNIGLMIYFAFTRGQMALGMLAAFGSILVLVICLGLVLTAVCFIIIGSSGY